MLGLAAPIVRAHHTGQPIPVAPTGRQATARRRFAHWLADQVHTPTSSIDRQPKTRRALAPEAGQDRRLTKPALVDSLLDQAKDSSHRVADSVRTATRLGKEAKIGALALLVLAVVIALFCGTGRDHAGLTFFTLSGSDAAPWRDIIVGLSVAYIVLVLAVAPFELLADVRSVTRPELFGKFAYLLVLLFFGFSLIYYYLGSKQLWSPNDLSHVSAMFVTMGTIVTAGFAGVEPKSDWVRLLLVLQMIVDIVLVASVGGMALQRYGESSPPSNIGQSDRAETS